MDTPVFSIALCDDDPADLRATLVDLEGAATTYGGMPRAIYRPYYDLLFSV